MRNLPQISNIFPVVEEKPSGSRSGDQIYRWIIREEGYDGYQVDIYLKEDSWQLDVLECSWEEEFEAHVIENIKKTKSFDDFEDAVDEARKVVKNV